MSILVRRAIFAAKIFPEKFRIWPPNSFGGLNEKSASKNKVDMRFRVDLENFMQQLKTN